MNLCQTDLIRVVVAVLLAKCVTPCNRGGVVKKEQSGKGHHILLLQPVAASSTVSWYDGVDHFGLMSTFFATQELGTKC